jgi:hypothetical protein
MALSDYLVSCLGGLATQLGWSGSSTAITTVVNNTLEAYPATLEINCTDSTKLHKLADYYLWKMVKTEIAFDINYNADGVSLSRSQMFDHISELESDAFSAAIPYLSEYAVTTIDTDYTQNPYDISTYFVEF